MPYVAKKELLQMAGWESEPGSWFRVDQGLVDRFAEATRDHQFIHVDPERAAETSLGGTVAHGFLTLSLLPYLSKEIAVLPEGAQMAFNYGLDRVRFPRPVKVGSEVRLRWKILEAVEKMGRLLVKAEAKIELRGEKRPAMVAHTLTLFVMGDG